MNIHKAFQNMQSVAGLFKEPTQEIKQNLKARLTQRISSYGFVSREAFDIQTQILLRTRAKLEALERRLAQFEEEAHRSTKCARLNVDCHCTQPGVDGGKRSRSDGRSASCEWVAVVFSGWVTRSRSSRKPGARARRFAQRIWSFRPPDCAWHSGGQWTIATGYAARKRICGRIIVHRRAAPDSRRIRNGLRPGPSVPTPF